MKLRISVMMTIVALAACTREDTDFAKHKLDKAKEEIKQDARKAETEVQHSTDKLRHEVRKGEPSASKPGR